MGHYFSVFYSAVFHIFKKKGFWMTFQSKSKSFIYDLFVLLFLCFFPSNAMGIEEVVIGQDTVLTTGNKAEYSGDAFSNGTDSYARVLANPGTDSVSQAKSGVKIDLIGYENGPNSYLANLIFEFEYSIIVNYPGWGSADAHINASFSSPELYGVFNKEFFKRINFIENPGSGREGGIITLQTTEPIYLEKGFSINADISLYAHAGVWEGVNTALAYSSANLKSVTIDFLPPPVAVFSYLPAKPILGDAITFDASESVCPEGLTCEYFWAFNDEAGDTGKTINKTFHDVGKYNVGLTVIDMPYGQEHYSEKKLTFAPAPFAFPYPLVFTTVVIDGSPRPTSGPVFLKLSNHSSATADLKISNVSLVEDKSGIFAIDYDTCTGESIAPDAFSSGAIIVRLDNVEKEGVAALAIGYNSLTGGPFYIPIMHKIYSVSTPEKFGEIESMCQNLKEILISGFLDPLIMEFPDTILDYEDIMGKEFYFKEGKKEDITTNVNQVHFSDTLLDKIINAQTTIKVLPFSVTPLSPAIQMTLEASQSTGTEELFLIDFLQITGDTRWFTFIDTIEYDIGGIAVEAFKFIFFQSNGNTATGYSIVYGKDTEQILELTRVFGSTDIMDMTPFKSDYDIDMDSDGKNLSDFANKYIAFDLMADLNSDGIVDIQDLTLFAAEFGK